MTEVYNLDEIIPQLNTAYTGSTNYAGNNEYTGNNNYTGGSEKKEKTNKTGTAQHMNMENYVEVPKTSWSQLPKDTYVRYIDKDGKVRAGGKVKSINLDNGETVMSLGKYNVSLKKFFMWKVKFRNISKLYKYNNTNTTDPVQQIVQKSEKKEYETDEDNIMNQLGNKLLFEEGDLLKQEIESVKGDIKRLDENMIELFGMIKKLYKKLGLLKKTNGL